MSEIGYLSNQYERIAQANQFLNDAVLLLKKSWLISQPGTLRKYPNLSVNAEDLREAQVYILEVLQAIVHSAKSAHTSWLAEANNLPQDPDLMEIVNAIQESRPLQEKHFSTLSRLLDELDGERSVLFRKLQSGK